MFALNFELDLDKLNAKAEPEKRGKTKPAAKDAKSKPPASRRAPKDAPRKS